MGRINEIVKDTNISDDDFLLGSDSDDAKSTKSYPIGDIATFVLAKGGAGGGDMLAATYDPIIDANTAKVSNVDHPLVETAVPVGAVFTDTDTIYDDTAIQAEVDLNTAKVSNIDHPLVETAVPLGAVFTDTDTVYDDTALQAQVTQNATDISTNVGGIVALDIDVTNLETSQGVQDTAIGLNTAKVGVTNEQENTINSIVLGEPTGSDVVLNVVSLTQAEFDAGTPIATTFYIITDA